MPLPAKAARRGPMRWTRPTGGRSSRPWRRPVPNSARSTALQPLPGRRASRSPTSTRAFRSRSHACACRPRPGSRPARQVQHPRSISPRCRAPAMARACSGTRSPRRLSTAMRARSRRCAREACAPMRCCPTGSSPRAPPNMSRRPAARNGTPTRWDASACPAMLPMPPCSCSPRPRAT